MARAAATAPRVRSKPRPRPQRSDLRRLYVINLYNSRHIYRKAAPSAAALRSASAVASPPPGSIAHRPAGPACYMGFEEGRPR